MRGNENLKNCTFIKTFLMLLVILGHACAFWSGNWFNEIPAIKSVGIEIFYSWINSFHVHAFTLVSGYLFAYKVLEGSYNAYLPFLRNKAKRLLVPYFFVTFFWVAPISTYFFKWDYIYLVKKYLLAINPSQLWFLWMLFGVFAILWPMRMIILRNRAMACIISFFFYVVGILGNKVVANIFCVWTACRFIPFFIIGMRIRVREEMHERLITTTIPYYYWIALDFGVFVCIMILEHQNGQLWNIILVGLNFCNHVVGAIMAWTTLHLLATKFNWMNNIVLDSLSSYSMSMYLFHQQIIYFTIVWLNGKIDPWIHVGINFMVAITGSYLISTFLMQWERTRFLIGEKR